MGALTQSPAKLFGAVVAVGLLLAGCESAKVEGVYPDRRQGDSTPYGNVERRGSVFGESAGFLGLGGRGKDAGDGSGGGIGVNSYLWRASLDTVSFMPVNSADPFGGVIVTDWHAMPETPQERFKMNVYILGRSLRADGIRVAVFRQVQDGNGSWRDAPIPDQAGVKIEDAILMRARQLRFDTLQE
ncbi:MAG: DUF3576 domain-containing protein [Rhodospirillales bacterium]